MHLKLIVIFPKTNEEKIDRKKETLTHKSCFRKSKENKTKIDLIEKEKIKQ